ncbi:S-adenosyl-L-methionine-dependent methyltransferases superfamily protein [Wolffia australiana]
MMKKEGLGGVSSCKGRERSAYFARREAAKVLKCVLEGDARRRAAGSIKSLVYGPSVRNKKATLALVCQTLKCLPLLKEVLAGADLLKGKWKRQEEMMFVTAYDLLFGKAFGMVGDVEKFLLLQKNSLSHVLQRLCAKGNVKSPGDLLQKNPGLTKPRYVRVNTLKLDVHTAIMELEKDFVVNKDEIVPDLLVLPPGTDLHDHSLVKDGSVFLQGKSSSMAAAALMPEPGWKVLDACSAPGNKTIHLAALMKGSGQVIACELHCGRIRSLESTVSRSGATNIHIVHSDFLKINPLDPLYSEVRAILLDPSCSGSGTSTDRLDYLLPSYSKDHEITAASSERVMKLAAFQKKALAHALSFPSVEKVVYSTCSIFQAENEDVVSSVLPLASSLGFRLGTPFPDWHRRGLPVFDGSEHLVRTNESDAMDGFFIALFVKEKDESHGGTKRLVRQRQSFGVKRTRSLSMHLLGNLSFASLQRRN